MQLDAMVIWASFTKKMLDPFDIVPNVFQSNKFQSNTTGIVFLSNCTFIDSSLNIPVKTIPKYHLNRLYKLNIALINPFVYCNYRTNSFNKIADVYK